MPSAVKPKTKRKPNPRGIRSSSVKDPVEKTDRYVAGTAVGEQSTVHQKAIAHANRLKDLIVPQTEAMVQVMINIAKDEKVHASIRMECADRLLSRAYGKPKEHVVVEDPQTSANEVDEVRGLLNNILESIGAPLLEDKTPEE